MSTKGSKEVDQAMLREYLSIVKSVERVEIE